MKVTPSPKGGGTPRGKPLDPHLRDKTHKKFQAIITRVRVIFRYVHSTSKKLKLLCPAVPLRCPEAGFSHNYNKFLKKPECGNLLVLNFNNDVVSGKVTLAVTLIIKNYNYRTVS
jgi:hypothetical protein